MKEVQYIGPAYNRGLVLPDGSLVRPAHMNTMEALQLCDTLPEARTWFVFASVEPVKKRKDKPAAAPREAAPEQRKEVEVPEAADEWPPISEEPEL